MASLRNIFKTCLVFLICILNFASARYILFVPADVVEMSLGDVAVVEGRAETPIEFRGPHRAVRSPDYELGQYDRPDSEVTIGTSADYDFRIGDIISNFVVLAVDAHNAIQANLESAVSRNNFDVLSSYETCPVGFCE